MNKSILAMPKRKKLFTLSFVLILLMEKFSSPFFSFGIDNAIPPFGQKVELGRGFAIQIHFVGNPLL